MNNCENCKKEHSKEYGSGRFCSSKCARGFSTKAKRKEINKKVSKTIKDKLDSGISVGFSRPTKKVVPRKCLFCNGIFNTKKNNQRFCSKDCSFKSSLSGSGKWKSVNNKLTSEDWSRIQKRSYAIGNGRIGGGRTKWYSYKKIRVQGTYELRTCKILDSWKEFGFIKKWEYTNDRIQYLGLDEKYHSYLIDFKIYNNDGSWYYLEVKGYKTKIDELKWNAVKDKGFILKVWYNEEITANENKLFK